MIRSKSNILRLTLAYLGLFATIAPFCILIIEWTLGGMGFNIFVQVLILLFTTIMGLRFILIELPQILELTIDENKIVTKNVLNGKTKKFEFRAIDSFKISIQLGTKSGPDLTLILFAQSKALATISLRYIENVDQIIKVLEERRLRDLTEDEYGVLRLIRRQENS